MPNARAVAVSTTPTLEGREITSYLGVVTAHVVAGTNIFSDIFASWSDVFGGRSKSYQKQLQSINDEAIRQLKQRAAALGANCVLSLRIDHDEISGSGKSMFMVTVSGTAAVAEEDEGPSVSVDGVPAALGADELTTLLERRRIVSKAKEGGLQRDEETWEALCRHQIHEVAPLVLETFAQEGYITKTSKKRIKRYFGSLPHSYARKHLYWGVTLQDGKVASLCLQLIYDLALLDIERTEELLQRGDFVIQKRALSTALADKDSYVPEDVEKLERLRDRIAGMFPQRGRVTEKEGGFMSGTKEVWECECGQTNPAGKTYCSGCSRDIYGFKESQTRPEQVMRGLNRKIEVLRDSFGLKSPQSISG